MLNVTTAAERTRLEQHVLAVRRQSQHQVRLRKLVLGVVGMLVFLLTWEVAPRVVDGVNILMFPPPSVVAKTFWSMTVSGEIWPHMLASLYRILIGFVVGASTGVLVGVVTGSSALARYVSDPILHGLRAIPVIAIVPLAIVWLGLGDIAKIVLIAWGVVFPGMGQHLHRDSQRLHSVSALRDIHGSQCTAIDVSGRIAGRTALCLCRFASGHFTGICSDGRRRAGGCRNRIGISDLLFTSGVSH